MGRIRVAGKFLEDSQGAAFHLKGVVYGPFSTNSAGESFPEPDRLRTDLAMMAGLGSNCLRIFHPPSNDLLQACALHELRLLVTFPWAQHVDFLGDDELADQIYVDFREMVRQLSGNPAVLGYLVGNEVPPDIVRWRGAAKVRHFLEELVRAGRQADPTALFSYANFPSTEYLQPLNLDFLCFNLYLHQPEDLTSYLRRLHLLAGNLPLVIGEFGMDSAGEGVEPQAEYFQRQVAAFREMGVAGEVAFTFTDEWYTGGRSVDKWAFGLVGKDREKKPAYIALEEAWKSTVHDIFAETAAPRVSVIVCGYNAAETLPRCLESMKQLEYRDFEVIMVDDGSGDATERIVKQFPNVRYEKMAHAGLSAARNHGASLASGDILAYTDADCQVHPLWLSYAVATLVNSDFAAVGGPNIPPPARSRTQACVAAAPGGPREVMLDDVLAEHLPGCNLVVRKDAFMHIQGFDPAFRTAGDDVDFCWRLTACGYRLGYHPAAMVWHERRFSIGAFIKQQRGYGEAEASLWLKHHEAFAQWGTVRWQGRIYEAARPEVILPPRVYSGRFGDAPFQSIYTNRVGLLTPNSFEWFALASAWAMVDLAFGQRPLIPALLFLLTVLTAVRSAVTVHLEAGFGGGGTRALLALLCLTQPIIRGVSRWFSWFSKTTISPGAARRAGGKAPAEAASRSPNALWSTDNVTKFQVIHAFISALQATRLPHSISGGWQTSDLMVYHSPFCILRLRTATEYLGEGHNLIRVRMERRLTLAGWAALCLVTLLSLGGSLQLAPVSTQWSLCFAVVPFIAIGVLLLLFTQLMSTCQAILLGVADHLQLQVVGRAPENAGSVTKNKR